MTIDHADPQAIVPPDRMRRDRRMHISPHRP